MKAHKISKFSNKLDLPQFYVNILIRATVWVKTFKNVLYDYPHLIGTKRNFPDQEDTL